MKEFINALEMMVKNRPEWAKDTRIIVIAGRETLAEYNPGIKELKIKTKRCTGCGECCLSLVPNSTADIHWGADDEGKCKKVYKDGRMWRCGAGVDMPMRCFPDPSINTPSCEMEFLVEEID